MKYFFLLILVLNIVSSCNSKQQTEVVSHALSDTLDAVMRLEYNLPVDSFVVERKRVGRNQFISNILSGYGVDYRIIDRLARDYRHIFDVRKIRVGSPYSAFITKDSIPRLAYFVYEITKSDYVVWDFRNGIEAYTGNKPVTKEIKTATGIINSSLWNTMIENNINPELAIELSEIYAWSIDFFGIARGDAFKVIYEESFVDSVSLGVKRILGAVFIHHGKHYYAIPFEQDSTLSFYDERGESLRKAFLKAPLRYSRISSGYSMKRFHPVLKIFRAHQGVDYAAPTGTPVQTIGDGVVVKRAYQKGGGGNYLHIKHNSVYTTVYMHLSKFAPGIVVGKRVSQGDVIGYVGSTGLSSGPHLDFRVYQNGQLVNPLTIKSPPVKPVHKQNMEAFSVKRTKVLSFLNAIK
jgi:murein DD-endopeptidase MepM/ murein hydrolase activator NlpD